MNHLARPHKRLLLASSLASLLLMAQAAHPSTFALPEASNAALTALPASKKAKPLSSGVVVGYRTAGIATVGQPYPVTVDFTQVTDAGAKVRFTSDPTLRLAGANPLTLPKGSTSVTLTVTPSDDGLAFVNVFTRQGSGGSATSIPVQVGPPDANRKQAATATDTGLGGRAVKLQTLP